MLAESVDEDYVDGILFALGNFKPVNFDYGKDLFAFCRKFEYDWKRDLPVIANWIGYKYDKYILLRATHNGMRQVLYAIRRY